MYNHSRLGATRESREIKWLRLSVRPNDVLNVVNVLPLPLRSSLSRKTSLITVPLIVSNGRGVDVVQSSTAYDTGVSAISCFRRGRAPGCRDRGPSIGQKESESTSMVG